MKPEPTTPGQFVAWWDRKSPDRPLSPAVQKQLPKALDAANRRAEVIRKRRLNAKNP